MRDPDLVVRAQRAAAALESAWGRWRGVHGITTDPPPAVSSYVGYSLDAPWGEGRIVFGICAEEAEQLAELLERHDCVGPIHASVTAMPGDGPVSPPAAAAPAQPEPAGLLSVPAPAPASAGQQPLPPGAVGPRPSELLAPRHPGVVRDPDAVSPLTAPVAPETRDAGTPIARAASRAVEAAQAAQRTVPSEIAPAPPAGPEAPAGPGPWTPPASQPGGSAGRSRLSRLSGLGGLGGISGAGGESPELAPVPWPDRPGDPAGRPAAAAEVPGVPEVASFRFRRPVVMTERPAVPVAPADPAGLDDTVQTPVPVRPPGAARFDHEGDRDHDADRDRDRLASAARHADAATWGASEVPGQAAVTDSAV